MTASNALDLVKTLLSLVGAITSAIARGEPERVDKIIPATLRSQLAKAKADADAEEHFERQREMIAAGSSGEGQP